MGMRFSERFSRGAGDFAGAAAGYEKAGLERNLRARLEAERKAKEESRKALLEGIDGKNSFAQQLNQMQYWDKPPTYQELAGVIGPAVAHTARHKDPEFLQPFMQQVNLLSQGAKDKAALEKFQASEQAKLNRDKIKAGKEEKKLSQKYKGEAFNRADKIRREFTTDPRVVGARKTYDAYDQINRLLAKPDPKTGLYDVMGIFSFMRSLDPASTVRGSEFALAEGASGPWAKAKKIFNKMKKGHLLNDDEKRDMIAGARSMLESKLIQMEDAQKQAVRNVDAWNEKMTLPEQQLNFDDIIQSDSRVGKFRERLSADEEKYTARLNKRASKIADDPKVFSEYYPMSSIGEEYTSRKASYDRKFEQWEKVSGEKMTDDQKSKYIRNQIVRRAMREGTPEKRNFLEKMWEN